MKDFRSSRADVAPHRLRVFWVPQDFDADDEAQRDLVAEMLRESVGRDMLMNIVFGNLAAAFGSSCGPAGSQACISHFCTRLQ